MIRFFSVGRFAQSGAWNLWELTLPMNCTGWAGSAFSGFADWLSQVNVTSFPSVQATTVPSSSVRRMVTPA